MGHEGLRYEMIEIILYELPQIYLPCCLLLLASVEALVRYSTLLKILIYGQKLSS